MLRLFNPHLDAVEIVNRLGVLAAWLAVAWIQRWSANVGPITWRPVRVVSGALAVIIVANQSLLLFTNIDPRSWSIWASGLNYPTAFVIGISAIFTARRWRAIQAEVAARTRELDEA